MGYHIHRTIVFTSWKRKHLLTVHKRANQLFDERLVSPIVDGAINDFTSFFIAPDGSKEGWDTSERFIDNRKTLIDWLNSRHYRLADHGDELYVEYVEVAFGGDEPNINTRIVNHNGMGCA